MYNEAKFQLQPNDEPTLEGEGRIFQQGTVKDSLGVYLDTKEIFTIPRRIDLQADFIDVVKNLLKV